MILPPNTNKVASGHVCDVCQKNTAKYYNLTWYIHICSIKCFEIFLKKYNEEINNFSVIKLKPMQKEEDEDDVV